MSRSAGGHCGGTIVGLLLAAALLLCAVQAATFSRRSSIDGADGAITARSWPDARVDVNVATTAELTLGGRFKPVEN